MVQALLERLEVDPQMEPQMKPHMNLQMNPHMKPQTLGFRVTADARFRV